MVALNLPADVLATADGTRKLFNKWSYDDVEVKDISLQDYIQIRQQVYLPHTAGRFAVKRFRKAQVSFISRANGATVRGSYIYIIIIVSYC
jgi:small subunit ribosomal protein S5e